MQCRVHAPVGAEIHKPGRQINNMLGETRANTQYSRPIPRLLRKIGRAGGKRLFPARQTR